MAESVYKIIELVGTSPDSWEKAAAAAVNKAAKTLRDLRIAEISQLDIQLEDGKIRAYRAKVKLSFKYGGRLADRRRFDIRLTTGDARRRPRRGASAARGTEPQASLGTLGDLLASRGLAAARPPSAAHPRRRRPPARGPVPTSRAAARSSLSRERKGHGGKTATVVTGLELPARELESVARALRRALGCGATADGDACSCRATRRRASATGSPPRARGGSCRELSAGSEHAAGGIDAAVDGAASRGPGSTCR